MNGENIPFLLDTSAVELPESEKVYDRNTAVETIKCILALGCTIEKKAD